MACPTSIRRPASTSPTPSTARSAATRRAVYNVIGKINYAATPENQGQLTIQALPGSAPRPWPQRSADRPATTSRSSRPTCPRSGPRSSTTTRPRSRRSSAGTATTFNVDSIDPTLENTSRAGADRRQSRRVERGFGGETVEDRTNGCGDMGAADPYPNIVNCPVAAPYAYTIGGPGSVTRDTRGASQRQARYHRASQGCRQPRDQGRHRRRGQHLRQVAPVLGRRVLHQPRRFSSSMPPATCTMGPGLANGQNPADPFTGICKTPDPSMVGVVDNPMPKTFSCNFLGGSPGDPGTQVARQHVQLVRVHPRLVADPAEPDAQLRPPLRGAAAALRRLPAEHDRSADG